MDRPIFFISHESLGSNVGLLCQSFCRNSDSRIIDLTDSNTTMNSFFPLQTRDVFIVADPGFFHYPSHRPILKTLVQYVHTGNTLVLALDVPDRTSPSLLNRFLQHDLRLSWRIGKNMTAAPIVYHLKKDTELSLRRELKETYIAKAVCLSAVEPREVLYGHATQTQAVVAVAKVGLGRVVYMGNVEATNEMSPDMKGVLYELCGDRCFECGIGWEEVGGRPCQWCWVARYCTKASGG